MVSFYLENKNRLLPHFFIFVLFTFYILSTAVNILLFHFVLDINLAKIGMFLAVTGLGLLVWRDMDLLWHRCKVLILIIVCWSIYLCINSYLGATPKISFKLALRIFGAWAIALEIGLLLHQPGRRNRYPVIAALIVSLLLITLIWYLVSIRSPSISWFQQNISNYIFEKNRMRLRGLYLNPNELGYALVMHSMVLIWYSLHPVVSLFIIPFASTFSFIGILKSQSRNSLLGLGVVVILALIAFLGQLAPSIGRKKTVSIFLGTCIALMISIYYLPDVLPARITSSVIAFSNALEESSITSLDFREIDNIIQSIPLLNDRRLIWADAFEKWVARPWLGLGIGAYLHIQKLADVPWTTHNFVYGVLVEQGIIGLFFLFLFTGALGALMKNWATTWLLIAFPLTLLFDDLSPSYVFPVYSSLVLGLCFYVVLNRQSCLSDQSNC